MFEYFSKSVVKIQVSLKSEDHCTYMVIFRSVLLKMITVLDKVVEKIKTHVLWPTTFFFESRAFYEIMWKNIVQPDRIQMTIRRTRSACFVSKGTDTHSACVTITDFPQLQLFHERASLLHSTYIVCLVPTDNFSSAASDSFKRRVENYRKHICLSTCLLRFTIQILKFSINIFLNAWYMCILMHLTK